MTLAEFRKRHPRCQVGYPKPLFITIMMLLCAGLLIILLRYLLHVIRNYASIEDLTEFFAAFGAACLSMGTSAGVYATGLRLGEILDWIRKGRCVFAVSDDEALIVDETGKSVVFPLASVTKIDLHVHHLEIKMNATYSQSSDLDRIIRDVFNPYGDGPGSRVFFRALEPRVKKAAPQAEVKFKDIEW